MDFVDEIDLKAAAGFSAYWTLSSRSRVSSTLVREAASISIRSTKRPCSISRQLSHTPQGVAVMPVSQFNPFASRRAMEVFPTPRVPEKDKRDECALTTSRSPVRSAHVPGRRRQQRFVGAIYGLRPDNSWAGSETLEGEITKGSCYHSPARSARLCGGICLVARERHQTVAVDPQLLQALFAAQIEEIDNESGIVHFATEAADQFDRGVDSAAVASRSSTTSTLSPGLMASTWISS